MTELPLSKICEILATQGLPATLDGDDLDVRAVNTLADATRGELSFLSNPKYLPALQDTRASAVIVKDGVPVPDGVTAMRCEDPYTAVTVAIIELHGHRKHPAWGLDTAARIHPSSVIGENPNIGPGVTIAAQTRLGANCTIYPGCYIGDDVHIGDDCTLYPNVVLYDGTRLGNRVAIHAGSVIGEDGLGYAPRDGGWFKIPMIGRAVIDDDVEIGANCAIDRGTLSDTRIGAGTKLGNCNVVGHGTVLGHDCMIVAQVGLAGSVHMGDRVIVKGQSGVSGHLSIGDDAVIGPMSGVANDVPENGNVFGVPATGFTKASRAITALRKLPEALRRLRELEKEVEEVHRRLGKNDI